MNNLEFFFVRAEHFLKHDTIGIFVKNKDKRFNKQNIDTVAKYRDIVLLNTPIYTNQFRRPLLKSNVYIHTQYNTYKEPFIIGSYNHQRWFISS